MGRPRPRKVPRMDPLMFLGYCNDDESPEVIEAKFRALDQIQRGKKALSEDQLRDVCDVLSTVSEPTSGGRLVEVLENGLTGSSFEYIEELVPGEDVPENDAGELGNEISVGCACMSTRLACTADCGCNTCWNRDFFSEEKSLKRGEDLEEVPLYGIDLYTRQQLLDSLSSITADPSERNTLLKTHILPSLRVLAADKKRVPSLHDAIKVALDNCSNMTPEHRAACRHLQAHIKDAKTSDPTAFKVYPKGVGVILRRPEGVRQHDFIGMYLGEVYPPWRWIERQIVAQQVRKAVRENTAEIPSFYNIALERHAQDRLGYGVVFVDAMRKGAIASRFSHSCEPNTTATVISCNGKYAIGMFALRDIAMGEEITFDYNCTTDSKEELTRAICLCGSGQCRGSYLVYQDDESSGHSAIQTDLMLHNTALLVKACRARIQPDEEAAMVTIGCRSTMLHDLPPWAMKFAGLVAQTILAEFEANKATTTDNGTSEPAVAVEPPLARAQGIMNNRVMSLALTLDCLRHYLSNQTKKRPAPLEILNDSQVATYIRSILASLAKSSTIKVTIPPANSSLSEVREAVRNIATSIACDPEYPLLAQQLQALADTQCFFRFPSCYKAYESPYTEVGIIDSQRTVLKQKKYSASYAAALLTNWHRPTIDVDAAYNATRKSQLEIAIVTADAGAAGAVYGVGKVE